MKVSVAWLRSLIPSLAGTPFAAIDGREMAARLTGGGLEVEALTAFGAGLENVVVARVESTRVHPSRSGLKLVTVDRGGSTQEIVCGAKNVPPPGGLVVLAPLGTHLPMAAGGKGMTIESRAIGGVASEGMLCSEAELGIAFGGRVGAALSTEGANDEGHEGILVLPEGMCEPGMRLAAVIPTVMDEVLEIGVTPNRPDALGHVGLARELAALLGVPFSSPSAAAPSAIHDVATDSVVRVTVDDAAKERCPHYGAHALFDVGIGPSPLWIRYRLHALGVRSISNAVDVTNLVMLEHAQPLHAFDLDRLAHDEGGSAIHVRLARSGEEVVTLDGITRTLTDDDLVICDGGKDGGRPVAIAGVMGAGNSEISATTKHVLLECAWFDPRTVRRTARRHGLHTESSHRFERGVDRGNVATVLAQAAAATVQLGGGSASSAPLHVVSEEARRSEIVLRHPRVEQLLGGPVDREEARAILMRLGCETSGWNPDGAATVRTPTHRPDLVREVDLIEEIARVRGLDAIPTVLPAIKPQTARVTSTIERRARHAARDLGLSEAISFAFASTRDLEILGAPEPAITLQNPLGEERSVMRTSLLPGLLAGVRKSRNRGERRIRMFEVGARFLAGGDEAALGLCDEVPSFAAVLAGPRDTWLSTPSSGGAEVDAWDAKGLAVELVSRLTAQPATIEMLGAAAKHLHPRGAAKVLATTADGPVEVGTFGPLHPDVVEALDLDGPVMVVELDLRTLERIGAKTPSFRSLPQMPASTRDVALEVDETVTAGKLAEALRTGAGALCSSVEIFDVYRGKGVGENNKSMAFRLTYRDPKDARTLTDAEIDAQHKKAIAAATSLGAVARV